MLFKLGPKGWEQQSSRLFYGPGPFEFLAAPGAVAVFSFVDLDGDLAWRAGEPSALMSGLTVTDGKSAELGSIVPASGGPPPLVAFSLKTPTVSEELVKVHRGDQANLDDERFTEDAAKLGWWQPADFAVKYGVGVSMLEAYDATRTPVIFVHGAEGSPANFRKLIAELDHTKFQPWVYSYPSGIRLELAATTLRRIVDDLQLRLKFTRARRHARNPGFRFALSLLSCPPRVFERTPRGPRP